MRLAVRFPAVESPLYLMENLPGGQPPPVLSYWLVGLLSQKKKGKKEWSSQCEFDKFLSRQRSSKLNVDTNGKSQLLGTDGLIDF